jgi:hypothetical protein
MTTTPSAGEATSTLATAVTVRPVVARDLPALEKLLHALDAQSRYRRWFSVATDVHAAAVWAADANGIEAVGLVATTVDEEIIGHAAFITMDTTRAEVCFEVRLPPSSWSWPRPSRRACGLALRQKQQCRVQANAAARSVHGTM